MWHILQQFASSFHVGMTAAGDGSAVGDAPLRDGGDARHWAAHETLYENQNVCVRPRQRQTLFPLGLVDSLEVAVQSQVGQSFSSHTALFRE